MRQPFGGKVSGGNTPVKAIDGVIHDPVASPEVIKERVAHIIGLADFLQRGFKPLKTAERKGSVIGDCVSAVAAACEIPLLLFAAIEEDVQGDGIEICHRNPGVWAMTADAIHVPPNISLQIWGGTTE